MLAPGSPLLKNRYELVRHVSADELQQCEVWDALANPGRNDEYRCLIRVWPFGNAEPSPFLFTLWTRELRHQLRLASLAAPVRGPKPKVLDEKERRIRELERDNALLVRKVDQQTLRAQKAEAQVEFQKKISCLLGAEITELRDDVC